MTTDDPILDDPDLTVTDDVRDEEARTADPKDRHDPLSAEEAAMQARREEEESLGLNDDPDPGYLDDSDERREARPAGG